MRFIVAAALALAAAVPGAQSTSPDLLARVSAYVGDFYRRFGSIVAEERYQQTIRRSPGSIGTTLQRGGGGGPVSTTLVSDFLLVQVPGEGWLPFRDVFERDGQPVRDREERLAKIFLSGSRASFDQARAIMNESARYNIGNVQRNINVPTLALTFLTDDQRTRFAFKLGKPEDEGAVIDFRETARPTYVRTTNDRDLPVNGRLWVDEQTGTIRRTELHAVATDVEAHITVTFLQDQGLGLWVPARMEERYKRGRDPLEVRGIATYSRFRRFEVKTSESIDEPK
ncbi:MAG TPA: hypothetical protein VKB50_24425 [Vicinamibacterales bacterium]|nr:hypothetical protein [Vicinamibacterales bacterium]